jgi:hypothetical protein
MTTRAVNAVSAGTFTAAYGGVAKSLNVAVRPIYLTSLVLSPSIVVGGTSVNAVVTSECAAPAGGLPVSVTSTNTTVASPAVPGIVLPQGATTGSFVVKTNRVSAATAVSIRATAHAVTKSATMTVQ